MLGGGSLAPLGKKRRGLGAGRLRTWQCHGENGRLGVPGGLELGTPKLKKPTSACHGSPGPQWNSLKSINERADRFRTWHPYTSEANIDVPWLPRFSVGFIEICLCACRLL